jgi:hypothetical protein
MAKQTTPLASELNTEQTYLRRIDSRIAMLSHEPAGAAELARMQAAREDVASRMSPEDLKAYEKATNTAKTREQIKAEAEAERVAMEANRDKPAI